VFIAQKNGLHIVKTFREFGQYANRHLAFYAVGLDDAPDYQKTIFNGLFSGGSEEILVSSLKNKFYTDMSSAKSKLKKAAQQYYDPKARRAYYWTIAGIILIHLPLIPLMFYFWGILAGILTVVSMFTLLILNGFMIKKNKKGIQLFSELKGFREFIKTAEENKLKMLIKEQPNYFESTLAYALSFGIFSQWAKKFSDLNVPPPTWYHGTHGQDSEPGTTTDGSQ